MVFDFETKLEKRQRRRDRRGGEVPVPQHRARLHDDHGLADLALVATAFDRDESGTLAERQRPRT